MCESSPAGRNLRTAILLPMSDRLGTAPCKALPVDVFQQHVCFCSFPAPGS